VENSRAALRGPGDWVHAADGFVYYWPRPGEDMGGDPDISIPVEEVLLSIDGAHHVEWHGVAFEQSGWLHPSSGAGYIEIQSGWLVDRTGTAGAVRVSGGRDLAFMSCVFRHLGASGLQLADASQRVNVTSCAFDDISGHGLVLGQIDDGDNSSPATHNAHLTARARRARLSRRSVFPIHFFYMGLLQHGRAGRLTALFGGLRPGQIRNNTVRRTPAEFHGCNAIWGGYLRAATIRNNDIRNCTHSAIAIGWGWRFTGYSSDNLVAANRIVYGNTGCCGGAGVIYTLGGQNGTRIEENFIANSSVRHNPQGQGAIHHDEGSQGVVTACNVIDNAPEWVRVHNSRNISLEHNFANAHKLTILNSVGIRRSGNVNVTGEDFPPGAQRVIDAAGLLQAEGDGASPQSMEGQVDLSQGDTIILHCH
jgi:hypothetical protein